MSENEALGAILEQINEPVIPNDEANEQIAEQTLQNDSEEQLNQVKATNAEQSEIINAQNEQINALQSKIDELSKALENALNQPQDMSFDNYANDGNVGQIQEQLNAMRAEQDELRARADFNMGYQNFKQNYPTIDGDMLLSFAKNNGYEQFLGDFKGWEILAKLMINEAKPKQAPDPITTSSSSGVFTQKGIRDDASDIEIGAEILNISKGLR